MPEEDFYELERLRKKALEESSWDEDARRRDYTRQQLKPGHDDKNPDDD